MADPSPVLLPPIKPGAVIGVMAPSSYIERDDIEKSAAVLEARGYKVFVHPQTYLRHNQSAGTHEDKLSALCELYNNAEIKAIWTAGGGNRGLHLIDRLDYDLIARNPKPMIGFSDVTALLNAIYVRTGVSGFHAPVFRQLHSHDNLDETLAALAGKSGACSPPLDEAIIIREGHAKGTLIGGNLSIFQYLAETLRHQTLSSRFWEGAILLLEDCNEELSRIDRMLLHLKRLGVLEALSGLVFGQFTSMKDSSRPFGFDLRDIIEEHCEGLTIPILMNTPFGHGQKLYPQRIGDNMELNITKNHALMHCF